MAADDTELFDFASMRAEREVDWVLTEAAKIRSGAEEILIGLAADDPARDLIAIATKIAVRLEDASARHLAAIDLSHRVWMRRNAKEGVVLAPLPPPRRRHTEERRRARGDES